MAFQDTCMRALQSGGPRAGVLTHLTPVKLLKNSKGKKTTFRYEGRCKESQIRQHGSVPIAAMTEKSSIFVQPKVGNSAF
jgi:hypothetical protein